MNLRERAGLIATVSSALSRGEHTLTVLPDLLKQLLEEGAWREFETKLGKHVTYDRFEDFVVTHILWHYTREMERRKINQFLWENIWGLIFAYFMIILNKK